MATLLNRQSTLRMVHSVGVLFAPSALGISALAALLLVAVPGSAQVFEPGPSDSSLFETVINLPPDPNIGHGESIGDSTQLNVSEGGEVGSSFDANPGSEINVYGGTLGFGVAALSGSEVNVLGGYVGHDFIATEGSFVNVTGGTVGYKFDTRPGSVVSIGGGTIGDYFTISHDSSVTLSGGSVGRRVSTFGYAEDLKLLGGEFQWNGVPYTDATVRLDSQFPGIFTGTLADGSVFLFNSTNFHDDITDQIRSMKLTAVPLPAADTTPQFVDSVVTNGPSGLRAGQTMTVQPGGSLRANFALVDASLLVAGGSVGYGAEAFNSVVNISDGTVGDRFEAFSGSRVDISGGSIGRFSRFVMGSELNMSGGILEPNVELVASTANISGGSIGSGFIALAGSEVNVSGGLFGEFVGLLGGRANISGGTFGDQIRSSGILNISGGTFGNLRVRGGEVHLYGSEFLLDGVPLATLTPGTPFAITHRDVTLSGLLADGSAFSFDIDASTASPNYFSSHATLTITLGIPGDFNNDSSVNGRDYLDWQRGNSPEPLSSEDLANWQFGYQAEQSTEATSIPEPCATTSVLAAALAWPLVRRLP